MSSMANLAPNNMSHEVPSSKSSGLPSNSYYGASLNNISMSSQINSHINKQQTAAQSYISAASIFKTMEENISKNVLNMIGVQKNKNNMMAATICNVIDSVMANTYNIFNKKIHNLADSINNNNNIMLNNINEIIGKNNKNMIHHINNLINKMDDRFKLELNHINESMNKMVKKIDGMNIKIMSEEEEKESLVEILLNDIDIVKSKINLYEINNNKFNELINESKKLEKNIEKKENIMAEIINNKFEKIENIINNKKNQSSKVMINKLDEMNKEILNIKNECEASTFSNDGALQRMVKKLDNNNKANVNKLDEMNLNILNIKNELEESALSNSVSLQRIKKKLDDSLDIHYKPISKIKQIKNNHGISKLTDSSIVLSLSDNKKNKKNKKNNNNKKKKEEKDFYGNTSSPSPIQAKPASKLPASNNKTIITSTSSILRTNNNNNNRIGIGKIITRNKKLYGESIRYENAMEFYINCERLKNGCVVGHLWRINIKNDCDGICNVYVIVKINNLVTKKYLIPDSLSRTRLPHIEDYLIYHFPTDDRKKYNIDINHIEINGKPVDGEINLVTLFRSY